jgi:hypothetical protein
VLIARLICSEPACAAAYDAEAAGLAELETLACDCGCGLWVRRVAEAPDRGERAVALELLVVA